MKYGPYSHSRIQTGYCPFAFRRRYIERKKGVQRGNSNFGKVIHLILADIIKAQVVKSSYNITELIEKHIEHELLERLREIQEILQTFSYQFTFNADKVVGVEEAIAVDIDGNEAPWDDCYIRGVLDLIEIDGTHATIIDHKTQFNILNQEQMDHNLQLSLYCYLAKCMYPQLQSFTIKIYFARYGVYRSSQRSLSDLEKCKQELDISISKIEEIEEWVPISGNGCAFCEYIHECPLAQYDTAGKEPPQVMNEDQAVKEARLIRVREEQVKIAKERLKAWCSSNGPISVSEDFSMGFVANEKTEWVPGEVRKIFDDHGHEIDPYMKFSTTDIKKLLSRAKRLDPEFADDLERAAKVSKETRFKGFRK